MSFFTRQDWTCPTHGDRTSRRPCCALARLRQQPTGATIPPTLPAPDEDDTTLDAMALAWALSPTSDPETDPAPPSDDAPEDPFGGGGGFSGGGGGSSWGDDSPSDTSSSDSSSDDSSSSSDDS